MSDSYGAQPWGQVLRWEEHALRDWQLGLLTEVLPITFPGLFWGPTGGGGGWMEKADDFPGLRPRLKFANSVKTNTIVSVLSPSMTENNQEGSQEGSCRMGNWVEKPRLKECPARPRGKLSRGNEESVTTDLASI